MPNVPPPDRELVFAYLGATAGGGGGAGGAGGAADVSPDELLVLLRALPMRYQGPRLKAGGGSGVTGLLSNPLTASLRSKEDVVTGVCVCVYVYVHVRMRAALLVVLYPLCFYV